ncbi:hypothetical protein TPHA_0B04370 [Tetrapisispora phaffii CBS 4417]|uniref:Uncharacterized protein n=1 Tax=Tetrapisispora phaffii (strain ATCC 24235 / CBS 4417 / NBRC 1672 / NRRL Y-8282 / UCD 70-5) TaxID=1071381 RepID=G8BQ25_TETPH|nr:hypothetical protein TPHA_0B04370 [Tetrapisispora phaffii CBS 4417]CCE62106.1 hypothetical protein TPHA_0B04370 [Tetrapisispora phaffii CBS 4417]
MSETEEWSSGVFHRDYQISALSSFIQNDPDLTPPNLIIQGASSTGKTFVLEKFFNRFEYINGWLRPIELVSWKPLLQAVARTIQQKLRILLPKADIEEFDYLEVEGPHQLQKFLEKIFMEYSKHTDKVNNIFLIIDGLDSLQDLDASIFLKMLALHELLPPQSKFYLKIIYTVKESSFLERYATNLIPTIIFSRYTLKQVSDILEKIKIKELVNSDCYLNVLKGNAITNISESQSNNLALNFIRLIIQAFQPYTGNDISVLSEMMDSKWEEYVSYITKENIFSPINLYRSSIKIFLHTNESLTDELEEEKKDEFTSTIATSYELSTISKYLLISAYFGSYLHFRYDGSNFSRKSHLRTGRNAYGRRKKMDVNPRYLNPSLFTLERLLAIFQSIYPTENNSIENGTLETLRWRRPTSANIEVFQNLAELHTLKLISTTSNKNIDFLAHKLKWKVNVTWETIKDISDSVGFEIGEYFSNIHD